MSRQGKFHITDLCTADRNLFPDHGKDDAKNHRPYRQHPDTEEVDRFMASDNPVEYLHSSLTRSAFPEPDDRYSAMAEHPAAASTYLN
jgi:hypothetical protein